MIPWQEAGEWSRAVLVMLAACSISGSVVALVVWGVRAIGAKRLPAWAICSLWLVVLARLVIPWTPESPASLLSLGANDEAGASAESEMAAGEGGVLSRPMLDPFADIARTNMGGLPSFAGGATDAGSNASAGRESSVAGTLVALSNGSGAASGPGWRDVLSIGLVGLWLAGVGVVAAQILRARSHARAVVVRSVPASDAPALNMLEDCRVAMGMRRIVALRIAAGDAERELAGPCVAGVLQPVIVLPAESLRLNADDLRGVLLHELAHIRRLDLVVGWVWGLALAVHWFNPAAWLAARCLRRDRELACDQAVLDVLGEPRHLGYGRTLVRLAERVLERAASASTARRPAAFAALLGIGPDQHTDDPRGRELARAELFRRCTMITGYRSFSWPARLALVLAIACTGAATLTAPVVSAAPGASGGARAGAPKVNIVESDQTALEMYFKPYTKDEGGRVAVPNVEVIAMPEYQGVSEDGSERTIDKRLTVVVQDRAHQFWPVIMRLSKKDAAGLYDGLDQAAKMREDSGKFAKRFSKGDAAKEKEILADIERTNAERGAAVLNMRHGALKLQDENMVSLPKEAVVQVRMPGELDHRTTIWINGAPDGAGWYMVVYANQQTVEALRDQLGRILGRDPGQAAQIKGAASQARLRTAGLKLNEWRCAELASNSTFTVKPSKEGKGVLLSLVDGQTEKPAAEVLMSADAARALGAQVQALLAARKANGTASQKQGTMEACVAALPYTLGGDGVVELPAGLVMRALPAYHGVMQDGSTIADERVTIVADDAGRGFWPILARVDDDVASRLAEALQKAE